MVLACRDNSDLMPDFLDHFFDPEWLPMINTIAPAVNIRETEKAYAMEIAVPGLKKEHCFLNVDQDGNLNVRIENKNTDEKKKEHYLRREFSYGDYEQSYALPDDVNKEQISAKFSDGLLKIELPKYLQSEGEKKYRKIEVA